MIQINLLLTFSFSNTDTSLRFSPQIRGHVYISAAPEVVSQLVGQFAKLLGCLLFECWNKEKEFGDLFLTHQWRSRKQECILKKLSDDDGTTEAVDWLHVQPFMYNRRAKSMQYAESRLLKLFFKCMFLGC